MSLTIAMVLSVHLESPEKAKSTPQQQDLLISDRFNREFSVSTLMLPLRLITRLETALIWQTRDANDVPTFSFALAGQPITFGTDTVANTYLNRPILTAYFASQEDVNARALLAVRSNNPIKLEPLTTFASLIRNKTMARIRIIRNDAGNCVNFEGTTNPAYWNACLSAEITGANLDQINVINDIRSHQQEDTKYEFFEIPFTSFEDANGDPFATAQDCKDYIDSQCNVVAQTDVSSGYRGEWNAATNTPEVSALTPASGLSTVTGNTLTLLEILTQTQV